MGTRDVTDDTALRIPVQWVRWALSVGGDPFNIERARRMAVELMAGHGVSDWTLRIGGARDQAGSFRFRLVRGAWDRKPGTLTLSGPLMSLWDEGQRRDTILHEIAHIGVCPDTSHGPAWQHHARMVGAKPARLWGEDGEKQIALPWVGSCPGGHPHPARRNHPRKRWSCSRCHPGVFDTRFLVTWDKQ